MAKQVDIGPRGGARLLVLFSVLVACTPPSATPTAQSVPFGEGASVGPLPRPDPRDGDGDGAQGVAFGGDDCNDADPTVHPGAEELSGDAIDQDCDGLERCYSDQDGDGYGDAAAVVLSAALACDVTGLAPSDGDCDDDAPGVNPLVLEFCGDDIDQNCDGVADIDYDGCEFDTIGCEGSSFSDLSDGVAYAVGHGLSSVFVCAGDYEESNTVRVDAAFVLTGDTEDGGVRLRSSAQPVIEASLPGAGVVRLDGLTVECASRTQDGVYFVPPGVDDGSGPASVVGELAKVKISGCDVGLIVYLHNTTPYTMDVEDAVISANNQGAVIASNVEARFRRVTFADNDDTGAVSLYARDGGDYDLYFEGCAFVENHTDTGGAALDLSPYGNAIGSIGNVVLQDCDIIGNTSNSDDMNGGSGAIMMYFREDDQPTVTMYGGSITENVSILDESPSGIEFYTGSFAGFDVDFGLGSTDNTPVDVGTRSAYKPSYRFDTSATFFCDATVWESFYCEE